MHADSSRRGGYTARGEAGGGRQELLRRRGKATIGDVHRVKDGAIVPRNSGETPPGEIESCHQLLWSGFQPAEIIRKGAFLTGVRDVASKMVGDQREGERQIAQQRGDLAQGGLFVCAQGLPACLEQEAGRIPQRVW